jgi:hypothetical protein
LGAIQDELRTTQDNFPGIPVVIGFFKPSDGEDDTRGPLWQWLYRGATTDSSTDAVDGDGVHVVSLFDEFNGIRRPRVSFFQETLAAARVSVPIPTPTMTPTPTVTPTPTPTPTPPPSSSAPNYVTPPNMTAYTYSPPLSFIPSFGYYSSGPNSDEYNNGIVFQSNTLWSSPAMEGDALKLIHTINGSPNDAMEAAFNSFLSDYLEVYLGDIVHAAPEDGNPPPPPTLDAELWAGELQSWKDYTDHRRTFAPLEAPAGLTVVRSGSGTSTSNYITWDAVYGATSYKVQRTDLSSSSPSWADAVDCDSSAETHCTDTVATGNEYGYRVQAKNDGGTNTTPWAYVAVFLSESTYDGYVIKSGSTTFTPMPNDSQPAIWAGRGGSGTQYRGFLSFHTGAALSGKTVLGAKLRLYQATTTNNYTSLGPCMVDIKNGGFNGSVNLEGSDFTASSSNDDVARVRPPLNPPDWAEAEVLPLTTYLNDINKSSTFQSGSTQFRLRFTGTTNNLAAKWNSGESVTDTVSTPPQLIVRYSP